MRYLDLGTAKKISKIGLGTWQFGSREWGYGEEYAGQEAQAIVSRALELGVTLFDTAEIYGFGRSERILVGEVGVSNYSLARWRAAEDALGSRVLSNQVRYNLVDRAPERELLPHAESAGRMVIAYSPLAQGLLSGRYQADSPPENRVRATNPLFLPENLRRAGDLIAVLREVADAHSATPA